MRKVASLKKDLQYGVALVFFLSLSLLITGCGDDDSFAQWLESTHQARLMARREWPNIPYRQRQHQALKNYFSQVNQMALNLRSDPDYIGRFNEAVSQGNLQEICTKVFLPRQEWQEILNRCTKNRFFLCAEEVRAYPEMVNIIRGRLNPSQQQRFRQTAACQVSL